MSYAYGPTYCDRCAQPIVGRVKTIPRFSDSGARPDATVHADPLACGRPATRIPEAARR
ncbi:hypothetical protein [Streptomyces sp. NPDC085460]|uniref:hypothetical protein n=1 Tax=unclassified Streptomyces TaxID=2593676 RepID=UPI0037D4C35A